MVKATTTNAYITAQDNACAYFYAAGNSEASPASTPIVWDKNNDKTMACDATHWGDQHSKGGGNIGFIGGNVQFYPVGDNTVTNSIGYFITTVNAGSNVLASTTGY